MGLQQSLPDQMSPGLCLGQEGTSGKAPVGGKPYTGKKAWFPGC